MDYDSVNIRPHQRKLMPSNGVSFADPSYPALQEWKIQQSRHRDPTVKIDPS